MTEQQAPVDVAKLRELIAKATPGPWDHSPDELGTVCGWLEPDEFRGIVHCSGVVDDWHNNSNLIVALHNAAPALLTAYEQSAATIAAKDAEIAALREALRELMGALMLYDGLITDRTNEAGWSDVDGYVAYMAARAALNGASA